MHRTNIYLSDEQRAWLQLESKRVDMPQSEIIRRALDYWIELKSNPAEQALEVLADAQYPDPIGRQPFFEDIHHRLGLIEHYIKAMLTPEAAERLEEMSKERIEELFGSNLQLERKDGSLTLTSESDVEPK